MPKINKHLQFKWAFALIYVSSVISSWHVTSSAQRDERSINPSRHVSSNSGALKINNCKLDRCKIASQIFNRRISSSSSSLNQCFPVCRFFYTHPISFLTKKLEYRKVFFPSIPMNQIGSNRVRSGLQTISM